MEPADVRLENLTGARIADVRPIRVLDRGWQPADRGVARVVEIELGVFPRRRRGLGRDRVRKTCRPEHRLPRLDAFDDPRHPFRRRGGIDVEHDRLDRIAHRGVRIFGLEPPARDIAARRHAGVFGTIILIAHGEESHPIVAETRHHRMVRQQHHREIRRNCHGVQGAIRRRTGRRRQRIHFERLQCGHLHVDWKTLGALDEGARRIEAAHTYAQLTHIQLRDVGREQAADLDHRVGILRAPGRDVEALEDWRGVGKVDGTSHWQRRIGTHRVADQTQQDVVAQTLPDHRARGNLLARIAHAADRAPAVHHDKELPTQHAAWDLVIQLVADAVDDEDTRVGDRLRGDDLVVGLRRSGLSGGLPAPPGARRVLTAGTRCRSGLLLGGR